MSGLTPGFRAELRTRTEDSDYVITVKRSVMLALLDAADELDRLVAAVERVQALHSPRRAWGVGAEVCASCSGDEFVLHPCDTLRALATGTHPQAACPLPVGSRPYWMSEDQWDPCACILLKDHDGPCECSHTTKEN